MKTKFTLVAFFIATFFSAFAQQPPNGGFENFSNSFTPVGWVGLEDVIGTFLPFENSVFTFQDTTTFTQGMASVELVSDTIAVYSQQLGLGTLPAVVSLGTGALNVSTQQVSFYGMPFTYRPDSLIFDYKLTSPGIDTGGFKLSLTNHTAIVVQYDDYLMLDSNWVHIAVPLTQNYANNNVPDTLHIQFVSSIGNPIIGTTLHIDGVRLGYINPVIPAIVTALDTTIFCLGGSDTLQANTGTGYTYQWSNYGSIITGATSSSFVANSTGSYSVQIDSAGFVAYSVPVSIAVNHPQASLPDLNDTICNITSVITLHGSPAGGTYTGSGVTGSTFTPATANLGVDTITYTATDNNNCTGTVSATVFVQNCTGINAIAANSFSVYPNPANSILNINADIDIAGFNLQMFDVLGRLVISQTLTGTNNAIDVAKLANGTYVYRITDKDNGVVTQNKFTVVK